MGYTGRMKKLLKWLPLGDKDNFSAEVEKLMFSGGTPVILSKDSGIFTMVMSTFQQYEMAGNCDGSHGKLLKRIVKCLKESDVFEKDFPFYVILAYRIKHNQIYQCNDAPQFFVTIINKMETLDTNKLSTTLNAFLLSHSLHMHCIFLMRSKYTIFTKCLVWILVSITTMCINSICMHCIGRNKSTHSTITITAINYTATARTTTRATGTAGTTTATGTAGTTTATGTAGTTTVTGTAGTTTVTGTDGTTTATGTAGTTTVTGTAGTTTSATAH
eukprot:Em0014g327a